MAFNKLEYTKDWSVMDTESSKYFPTIETSEMQVRADMQLLHDEAKDAINDLIDDMEGSGASSIGVSIAGRTGANVQAVLGQINTDVVANNTARHTHTNKELLDTYDQTNDDLEDAVDKAHTHSNKSVLDAITDALISVFSRLVTVFTGVTRVSTTLTALDTDIPTCKAVTDAMSSAGNGDMMKSAYATQSDTKVDTALNAEALNNLPVSAFALQDDLEELQDDIQFKADLVNGRVPTNQLPSLNYIPVPANPTDGYVLTYQASTQSWIPQAVPTPLTQVYHVGTDIPSNLKLLWVDTTPVTGGLKYYDEDADEWKHVPVAFA